MNMIEGFLKSVRVYIQRAEDDKYLDLKVTTQRRNYVRKIRPGNFTKSTWK
jgi:hypothetical protein